MLSFFYFFALLWKEISKFAVYYNIAYNFEE